MVAAAWLPSKGSRVPFHLTLQSTSMRPSHHANASRSLFQNPWTRTTVEPNPNSTPPPPPLPENHDSDSDTTSSTSNSASASPSPSSPVAFLGLPALPFRLPNISSIVSISGAAASAIPISIERVRGLGPRPPHPPVKVVKPDWGRRASAASAAAANLKATWLGHASFLVEFPSCTAADEPPRVLFDPIFSDSAGPSPWVGVQRRLPPPCTVAELPEFQFVVYSHNHYDHLDLPTLQQIYELRGERVHFLVPLGNKTWFEETGIPTSQITELDWWDDATLPTHSNSHQELKFVCTPAQHTSGRGIVDNRTTLWASWVVEQALPKTLGGGSRASIYFAGDTGYMTPSGPCPIFEEIGSKYGPFDIAMLPIWRGGSLSFVARLGFRIVHTRESVLTSYHATPAHALRMHVALRARHSLAMHFATFAGSDVEALDPIVELEQAKREMMALSTGGAAREGEDGAVDDGSADDVRRMTTAAVRVGDWWMEGGMGVIDVGETATVHVGKSEPLGL
ncbi:Metallo-hydrolase/oxidoreductase [Lactarius psammicola]|nr:Metallo-hydrolase/oxidoreductase [Lactarius psammicola]